MRVGAVPEYCITFPVVGLVPVRSNILDATRRVPPFCVIIAGAVVAVESLKLNTLRAILWKLGDVEIISTNAVVGFTNWLSM